MNAIEITTTGGEQVHEFMKANASAIRAAYVNPATRNTLDKYLHGELEIVSSESLSTGTGITVRLYVAEGFREFLAAIGA